MAREKRTRRVIGSFTLRCEGVGRTIAPLLPVGRAGVSLTVYEDGTRELACAYLHTEQHTCLASGSQATRRCVHLYPVAVRLLPGGGWERVVMERIEANGKNGN
jgi:hypothetical protein